MIRKNPKMTFGGQNRTGSRDVCRHNYLLKIFLHFFRTFQNLKCRGEHVSFSSLCLVEITEEVVSV